MLTRACCTVCIVSGLLLAGCGSSDAPRSDRMVRTGSPDVKQLPNGRLSVQPAPMRLEDVEKLPKDSAEQSVFRLMFFAQWGSAPSIVESYDPAVVAALGLERLTGAYALLRPQLVGSQVRLVSAVRQGRRVFVAVELTSKDLAPQRESFLLTRSEAGAATAWQIVFDTLLERGLNAYVQGMEAKDPQKPDPAAVRAGSEAASAYRNAFSSMQLQQEEARERREARRRRAAAPPTPTATPAAAPAE